MNSFWKGDQSVILWKQLHLESNVPPFLLHLHVMWINNKLSEFTLHVKALQTNSSVSSAVFMEPTNQECQWNTNVFGEIITCSHRVSTWIHVRLFTWIHRLLFWCSAYVFQASWHPFWFPTKSCTKGGGESLAAVRAGSRINPANRVVEAGRGGRLAGIYHSVIRGWRLSKETEMWGFMKTPARWCDVWGYTYTVMVDPWLKTGN